MQQELRLIGVLDSEPRKLDWSVIKHCRTEQAAMRLCKDKSYAKYTDEDIADELGMTRASLNIGLSSGLCMATVMTDATPCVSR